MNLLHIPVGEANAALDCYLLDNSPEIDAHRTRPCIIVVPGGGYLETSDREAEPIAVRMLAYGYQACVLRYSTYPAPYPTALLELAQAMAAIRTNAEDWHIDPDQLFVAGFSAGGHLTASLGASWSTELPEQYGFDAGQIRPNGLLLGYPVISSGEFAHRPSFDRLLGDRSTDHSALAHVSIETRVTPDFPPTFLFHTLTDSTVPIENSLLLIAALRRAGVSVEAHLFPSGRHGVSLGTVESMYADGSGVEECVQVWPELFRRWLDRRTQETQAL